MFFSGLKDVLKKRLKNYYKRKNLANAKGVRSNGPTKPRYSHFLVIDFEATCDRETPNYPHEIIEFPVVLLDTVNQVVVSFFAIYFKIRQYKSSFQC